jgi:hypothetical protein
MLSDSDSGNEDFFDLQSQRLDVSLWDVHYRKPTYTKKGKFDIPYTYRYNNGKFGPSTVTYYVCCEQMEKGKFHKQIHTL